MRVRLITNSPTAFIMRSSRSSEMRTDLACAAAAAGVARRAGELCAAVTASSVAEICSAAATEPLASANSIAGSSVPAGASSSTRASSGSSFARISASFAQE